MNNIWKVCYEGGFYRQKGRGGTEIPVNSIFEWNGCIWHISALYACGKGIVADFCIEVNQQKLKNFFTKYEQYRDREHTLSNELRREIEAENPLSLDFRASLTVNGKKLRSEHGCSVSWISSDILYSDMENTEESENVVSHYNLDKEKSWLLYRCSFPWTTARKPAIKSIKLNLSANCVSIGGISFENPAVNDVIKFTHPITKKEHTMTVLEYEQQELAEKAFAHGEYLFPRHHWAMVYTLEPDIPDTKMYISDIQQNEQPKRTPHMPYEPQSDYSVSIGIIGGADGPTAIFASARKNGNSHIALSALHFEPVSHVQWKMTFREKLSGDIEINLLPNE
ncbi:MAG: hypothetical protein IKV85_08115 [Ruminococcus sp.]|nr:hypothetical protein [Ruminococcus sp.]